MESLLLSERLSADDVGDNDEVGDEDDDDGPEITVLTMLSRTEDAVGEVTASGFVEECLTSDGDRLEDKGFPMTSGEEGVLPMTSGGGDDGLVIMSGTAGRADEFPVARMGLES